MSDMLKASLGSLFIQLKPGGQPQYLGCTDLAAIAEPAGAETLVYCRDSNGDYTTVGSTNAAPGVVTTNLKALMFPESSILDQIKGCPVQLYAMQRDGGKAGIFANYVRGLILHHARVTNRQNENVVMREADTETTYTLDVQAWNPVYRVRSVKVRRVDIAETAALNALAVCRSSATGAACDAGTLPWQTMFTGSAGPAGSPAARAEIWRSVDAGVTWLHRTGAAVRPFAAGEDIKATACFQLDKTTYRWLVARENVSGEPLKVAYSDDQGATWTLVTVGSTNNEGTPSAGSLFVMDREHLWLATTEGNIYFSDDAGLTWTLLPSVTEAGGNPLNALKMVDLDNGYAVGDSGILIVTSDGGDTWTALTVPDGSANIKALWAFTSTRLIIGDSADGIYESWDGGDTWERKTFSGQGTTGTIKAFAFANDLCGFMLHNTAGNVGTVHRTVDGGYTWEVLATPTNLGLNDLVAGDENTAFVVGNASGGTSVLLKVSG